MNWYAKPENRTQNQTINDKKGKFLLEEAKKTDKFRIAHANALAKMQKDKTSKLELEVLEKIRKFYPLAEGQVVKDFYTVDIYVPEIDTYLDVHGNYWHNQLKHQSSNQRKRKFFSNKGIRYLELWGNEVDYAEDLIKWVEKIPNIYVLCGPSGAGKTWLANQLVNDFNIIDMDKLRFDECLEAASKAQTKSLVVINIQATRFVRELAEKDVRCLVAVINEDETTIKHRISLRKGTFTKGIARRIKRYQTLAAKLANFTGTQSEVLSWLKSQR
jgi:DNA replication protein DnaC